MIELLVVISIISLLIALLLPALSNARRSARQVGCLANLRTQGQAFIAFANDRQGILPSARSRPDRNPTTNSTLYVFQSEYARELAAYGLYDGPMPGTAEQQSHQLGNVNDHIETAWRCPEATAIGRFIRFHQNNHPTFRIDHFMLMTDLEDHPGFAGTHSPATLDDPIAPMVADQTVAWPVDNGWTSNHGRGGRAAVNNVGAVLDPDGHNQLYNDGHAAWYEFEGQVPLNMFMFTNGSASWYWIAPRQYPAM